MKKIFTLVLLTLLSSAVRAAVGDTFTAKVGSVDVQFVVLEGNKVALSAGPDTWYACIPSETNSSITIPQTVKNGSTTYTVAEIGAYAFYNTKITGVSIPASVEKIESTAFESTINLKTITVNSSSKYYVATSNVLFNKAKTELLVFPRVTSLKTYTIPSTVKKICDNAFMHVFDNLASVTIPSSVEEIGDYAFYNMLTITSFTIPASVKKIGRSAFASCQFMSEFKVDAKNTEYASSNGILFSKDMKTLLACPAGKSLGAYTIPAGVEAIADYAFSSNSSLTSLTVPGGVLSIGDIAFSGCRNLTTVDIASTVSAIGYYAFAYCNSLEKVRMRRTTPPSFPSSIDVFSEIDQTKLKIYVPAGSVEAYKAVEALANVKDCIVGDDTMNSTPESAEFAEYIFTVLDAKAKTVEVAGNDVNNLPDPWKYAIFTIPSKVRIGGADYTVTSIADSAFYNSWYMQSVTIPETVTRIGRSAFESCTDLSEISIPKSVTEIGDEAFAFNSSYWWYTETPEDVHWKGIEAFHVDDENPAFCSVDGVLFTKDKTRLLQYPGMKNFGGVYAIPEGTKEIAAVAFAYSTVESITIPSTVTTLGENCFQWMFNLEAFHVDANSPVYCSVDGVLFSKDKTRLLQYPVMKNSGGAYAIPEGTKEIGVAAFYDCTIESVTIPSTVTTLEEDCFLWSANLNQITIPASVEKIGDFAFAHSQKLKNVKLEATLTKLSDNIFFDTAIETLELPETVREIGNEAFARCTSLKTVVIPQGVTGIANEAFADCPALESVTSYIKAPFAVSDDVFYNYDSEDPSKAEFTKATLNVPAGTKALYAATDGWKRFATIVEMEPEAPYAVNDDELTAVVKNLEPDETGHLVIPEKATIDGKTYTVTEIAAGAYKGNKALTSVTIPETVTKIGEDAFAGCTNLKELYVLSETPISLAEASARGLVRRVDGTAVPSQFDGIDFDLCVLYVPYGCGEAYRNAYGWSLFKHIEEMVPEGIRTTVVPTDGQPADVYTPAGVLVKRQATTLKGLKRGVYIVDGKKVIVK